MSFDGLKAQAAEFLNLEPHNSWFSAEVDRSTGKPVVHVRVSEHFLKSHNHQMELIWDEFSIWKRKQMEAKGEIPEYITEKVTLYSDAIRMRCGCSGDAIYQKLKYLNENNGVDEFGRVIAGAKT